MSAILIIACRLPVYNLRYMFINLFLVCLDYNSCEEKPSCNKGLVYVNLSLIKTGTQ